MASTANFPSTVITLPNFSKTCRGSIFMKKKLFNFVSKKVVSCKANNADSSVNRFDRRDILLGLGGSLYGGTSLVRDPFALAAPIAAPDLSHCAEATVQPTGGVSTTMGVDCCPPVSTTITDFIPPSVRKIRYRPAAHLVDSRYLKKFEEALRLMRELDKDDPRSFMQQANVHCAYCNDAYPQTLFPSQPIQVHNSWLFFPFHRLYLYFFERILGKLINDPDFAIPYWNWDSPSGMSMPEIYVGSNSPLYDSKRDLSHLPPSLVNLNGGKDNDLSRELQIKCNLNLMYREMVRTKIPSLFFGKEYRAGSTADPGAGSVEGGSHIAVHIWVGDKEEPYHEDMGNFYSAGRDPIFYAHHANVDRMWNIWKTLPGKKRRDIDDSDWLDSAFLFYDENKNLVRVKVRDCLDSRALGYDYQSVDIPWLGSKATPRRRGRAPRRSPPSGRAPGQAMAAEINNTIAFPIVLDKIVRFEVPRPKKSRTKIGKKDEEEEEVLVIENIQLDKDAPVKFDVCINDDDDEDDGKPVGPEDSEFVGSFTNLPHGHGQPGAKLTTTLTFSISDLLEELGIEGEDNIVVTLVPQEGEGLVSIGNVKIDYIRD
ncbi:hypothetical protein Goari_005169 [Gossypium aridum]|uniref:Tyrosinase copper-binding domain-containing protein n=1 Tax=Gossypium aridum TaxID=34290 RepID=A0A7J8Y5R6_GOSAI|nr:hypothetical protein [Gossypium aridum]